MLATTMLLPLLIASGQAKIGPPAPRAPLPSGYDLPSSALDRQSVSRQWQIHRDVDDVRDDIRDGRETGQLTRREARGLRRQAGAIQGMASRYASDGLSWSEERELQMRAGVLRDAVNIQRKAGAVRKP